jgi:hypothetical protein
VSKSQRTKGATYEREVCDAFTPVVGYKVQRNIGQARDGGNDIDVKPLVIEAKRRKTLGTVYGWLQQAIDATRGRTYLKREYDPRTGGDSYDAPLIPVVVARQDAGESIVILRLTDFLTLTGDILRAEG